MSVYVCVHTCRYTPQSLPASTYIKLCVGKATLLPPTPTQQPGCWSHPPSFLTGSSSERSSSCAHRFVYLLPGQAKGPSPRRLLEGKEVSVKTLQASVGGGQRSV